MEAGESGAATKANILIAEFERSFRSIEYTMHPRDIPGEAQGKSSNLCWAARYINGKYSNEKSKQNIIVTVLDGKTPFSGQLIQFLQDLYTGADQETADSHLLSKYFTLINDMHVAYPKTAETTMYVPPIIFDRNAHLVPRLVRVADLLWAGAGLSGHYKTSSICPPTSVYSLPLSLVDRAGGWDAGEEAIGEDLHMYIKSFFAVNGHLTTRSVFSAASHSNVHSSGKGIRGFFQNIHTRYKQAMRHMWGALDSGFVLKNISQLGWAKCVDGKRFANSSLSLPILFSY
jgi:Glycosyl transferase family group 2